MFFIFYFLLYGREATSAYVIQRLMLTGCGTTKNVSNLIWRPRIHCYIFLYFKCFFFLLRCCGESLADMDHQRYLNITIFVGLKTDLQRASCYIFCLIFLLYQKQVRSRTYFCTFRVSDFWNPVGSFPCRQSNFKIFCLIFLLYLGCWPGLQLYRYGLYSLLSSHVSFFQKCWNLEMNQNWTTYIYMKIKGKK